MWITLCFGKNYHKKICENSWKRWPDEPGKAKYGWFQPYFAFQTRNVLKSRTCIHIFPKNRQTNVDNIFLISAILTIIFYTFPTPWKVTAGEKDARACLKIDRRCYPSYVILNMILCLVLLFERRFCFFKNRNKISIIPFLMHIKMQSGVIPLFYKGCATFKVTLDVVWKALPWTVECSILCLKKMWHYIEWHGILFM